MRILGKLLKDIKPDNIQYLKDEKISESKTLEYKKELPGKFVDDNWKINDNEKKEFLADISAFANTIGGTIIYGIEEEKNKGIPKEITGINVDDIDKVILRLEQIIRNGLQPTLNVSIETLDVDGKKILMIGIPRSLLAPHIIWYQNTGKFFKRTNSGKDQMVVQEIRQAFLETNEWEKEADNFRKERIMYVRSGEFIPNLDEIGSYFLHILPLGFKRPEFGNFSKSVL